MFVELAGRFALLDLAVDRGDRLLIGERHPDVGDHDQPGGDQRDGEDVAEAGIGPKSGSADAAARGLRRARLRARDE